MVIIFPKSSKNVCNITHINRSTNQTDNDAVLTSKVSPDLRMCADTYKMGVVTNEYEAGQHFRVGRGLCREKGTVSFEAVARPGYFLSHVNLKFTSLNGIQDSEKFKNATCFHPKYDKYFKVGFLSFFELVFSFCFCLTCGNFG